MAQDSHAVESEGAPGSSSDLAPQVSLIVAKYRNPGYRYLVLGILTIVYFSNYIDRQVINILAEFIIEDLELSDTQFGMLSGLAFALIYTTLGIPIAHLADISSRKNIIAISVFVWSIMTAVCASAQNFMQLFLARFGVGAGEAGGSPPSHSLLSDIFPASQRATALAVYSLGVNGGILVGTVCGAYLVQYFDWRTAFIVVGLPGVVLALVVHLVVKEPPRGMAEARRDTRPPRFLDVVTVLWRSRSFRHLSVACALHGFVLYGLGNFMPLFLGRVHDMPILDIGWYYGIAGGAGGALGTLLGGLVSDRLSKRTADKAWHVRVPMLATLLSTPVGLISVLFMPDGYWASIGYFFTAFLGAWYLAPCIAATHFLVGIRMRAMASAILFFVLNLIGLGLGPLMTGFLSDVLTPFYGSDGLRFALAIAILVNFWAAIHYHLSAKTIGADMAKAPQ